MSKFKPLNDVVIFNLIDGDKKTDAGIIIPDTKKKFSKGKVIAVSKGTEALPMEVQVGDEIYFPTNATTELEVDGNKVYLITQSRILFILDEDDK